jgi:hypothetical protein
MTTPAAYRFHPSSIASIMADPVAMDTSLLSADELAIWRKKGRTSDEQALMDECRARSLSAGAKTYLVNIAKEMIFGYTKIVTTREMEKGTRLEGDAIQLYNNVYFANFCKNTERRVTDLLSGECDIHDQVGRRTLDTKVAWSLDTFPVLAEDAHSSTYEWQGRGYMHLYDTDEHEVIFVMLSTPDDLRPHWEAVDLHLVDHIDPRLRITRIIYKRDLALERKMLAKAALAQKYLTEVVAKIRAEHGIVPDWKKQFQARSAA